jgi:glycosyl transferase family 25
MILNNIWVVNLDKSKDRLSRITKNLDDLGLKFNRFSAIYGKELDKQTINNTTTVMCRNLLCNHGMLGCSQSHKKLWQQLINDPNTNSYLILEDDALLNEKSVEYIKKIDEIQISNDIDLINLYGSNNGLFNICNAEYTVDDVKICKPCVPFNTTAYMVTKNGANKLLKNLGIKQNYHIDFEMYYFTKNDPNFKYYTTSPFIVDIYYSDTTVSTEKSSILLSLLKYGQFNYLLWWLNSQSLTIKMHYNISNLMVYYFILLIINKYFIKSNVLFIFIMIELILLM